MNCPNCNESDHPKSAQFCHLCGTKLLLDVEANNDSEDEDRKLKKKKRKRIVLVIVASLLYVLLSFMEYSVIGGWGFVAIVLNLLTIIQFITTYSLEKKKIWRFILELISPLLFFIEICFFPNGWSLLVLPATFWLCSSIYDF